jgi:very-short-patch-repair endonuclease
MFSEHPKSRFWSSKNQKNPDEVKLNSHTKFWFDCECGHDFETTLVNINQSNNWCPYCSNSAKKICDKESCISCFNKSFASHEKSKYWSDENDTTPRKLFKSSDGREFIFNCDCGHKISMVLKNISSKGHWCSFCSHQRLCEDSRCEMCFNNSFASVDKSKQLNDKLINPRMLFKSSNRKLKFDCELCKNVFQTQLSDVTRGVWCSFCVNKTELILFDILVPIHPTLKRQFKVDWCKKIKRLPFDFVIEDLKIIIELDGKQHFKQTSNWVSPEETKTNDLYKMKCANENGFSVIRLLQDDVYKNRYDWLGELNANIERIRDENRVQNIYMCKKNEYFDFPEIMLTK